MDTNTDSIDELAPRENRGFFRVAFSRYSEFLAALEKVNKKAAKFGVPPLTVLERTKVEVGTREDGTKKLEYQVKMETHPVRIADWDFIATIEHSGGKQNIIRFVPGQTDTRLRDFAHADSHVCDFCKAKMRRNNTYVVRNINDNEMRRVGGTCLQKHIGDEAQKLAKFAFSMEDLIGDFIEEDGREFGYGGGHVEQASDVETTLSIAVMAVNEFGFVRSAGHEDGSGLPTARIVRAGLFGYDRREWKGFEDFFLACKTPSDAVKAEVAAILAWFEALPEDRKNSDYMMSLESIINADYVNGRGIGLMASLPAAYFRDQNEARERATRKPSNWVGEKGQKIDPTAVKVVYTNVMDGQFGAYQIVKMVEECGNVFTWFNTSKIRLDLDAELVIVGTVKDHDEYKGVKQTVLTRVKVK